MRVSIIDEAGCPSRERRKLGRVLRKAARALVPGCRAEISVALVGVERMRRLNRDYRGCDGETDVLAFSMIDACSIPGDGTPGVEEAKVLGDIVICLPVARTQAEEAGWGTGDEIELLAVHGLLHLLGHEDETDEGAEKMREAEKALLGRTS